MEGYIVYFDEAGDDGVTTASSSQFVLTSIYMPMSIWQNNYDKIKTFRRELKEEYGFHVSQEMHTKNFITDKCPYRDYGWTSDVKRDILKKFTIMIGDLDLSIINVIIDKTKFKDKNYKVLENALKYNIQRIENDSAGKWNYIIITDKGRVGAMRKTARAIRAYNPIQSKYSYQYRNQPISWLIEDIMEKDSSESYFIQICDFISYFVYLYRKINILNGDLPNRAKNLIDAHFISQVMATLKDREKLNLKAAPDNTYGLVIYPK